MAGIRVDKELAVAIDAAAGAPELDGHDDEADEVEDKEDEGAEDDDAGEELALGDEETDEYAQDGRGADQHDQQPKVQLDCRPVVLDAHSPDHDLRLGGGGGDHLFG
ncbi:hypothetical protein B7463_g2053, partial [Scytalidium lignicola]